MRNLEWRDVQNFSFQLPFLGFSAGEGTLAFSPAEKLMNQEHVILMCWTTRRRFDINFPDFQTKEPEFWPLEPETIWLLAISSNRNSLSLNC